MLAATCGFVKTQPLLLLLLFSTLSGDLPGVEWLVQQGASIGPSVSWAAAAGGRTHILQLLASLDPPCAFDETTCKAAASAGQLDTLRWLRSLQPAPCPWNASTCEAAAAGGYIEVGKKSVPPTAVLPSRHATCHCGVHCVVHRCQQLLQCCLCYTLLSLDSVAECARYAAVGQRVLMCVLPQKLPRVTHDLVVARCRCCSGAVRSSLRALLTSGRAVLLLRPATSQR